MGQGRSGPPSRSSETWPAPCPSCLRLPRCERAGGEVCPANYPDYQCCCCYSRACPRGVLGCVEIRPPARGAWLNLPICIILILVICALGRRRSGDMQRACKGCQPQRDPNPGRHGKVTLSPHICRCQEVWGGSEGLRGRPSWGSKVRMMGVSPLCLPTELSPGTRLEETNLLKASSWELGGQNPSRGRMVAKAGLAQTPAPPAPRVLVAQRITSILSTSQAKLL